ncbi:MAG: SDR family NAD(P)-dependent oxidoreductase [Fastidiosipilaceae bacterium]|jgi:NAD(P)-dependent dehydrogenase (short-subunit alcohol dehydrogenase family)|nr:SDR family oxidoreductase [Clostridiaceae bacterium]
MFDFKDQVVALTGASSGLGVQMARGFAEQGATVILMARRVERLESLEKEIKDAGGEALAIGLDVTDDAQIDASIDKILEAYGKVDVLLNVAGGSKGGAITEMTNEAWDFTIELDLTSVFKMTRAYSRVMKEAGYGRIINIASMYGMMGTNQQQTAYHASKAGVINFTRAAAAELAPYGVTVNCICPGFFATELTIETLETDAFQQYMNISVPMARYGKEGELNSAAIFLAAKESAYVTGVILPIDGGWSSSK